MLLPKIYPVTCHTDHVGPGSTFVAISGYQENGEQYIDLALQKGATTIVVENSYQPSESLLRENAGSFISVPNTRKALAELSAQSLDSPAKKLTIIGITGTAGKTTTTYLIEHILRFAGLKTALLGGIKNKILDQEEESVLTTPPADYLHMFFAECVKRGVTHVVMEIASHALSLNRVHGIPFSVVGFTNLSLEHLDFHKTMDDYFAAKCKLFDLLKPDGCAVINTDDAWGKRAYEQAMASTQGGRSLVKPLILSLPARHSLMATAGSNHTSEKNVSNLPGQFNKYNITMAIAICQQLAIHQDEIEKSYATFPGVPGRMQCYQLPNGACVCIDYAHKPLAFENVLKTLRSMTDHLTVVFGCGGNRDKQKRPIMGRLAVKYADTIIITDDNPRFEDSDKIIEEIVSGISLNRVIIEPDRKKAIRLAIGQSRKKSIVAILGKGHEKYYVAQGEKIPFNDYEEVEKAL